MSDAAATADRPSVDSPAFKPTPQPDSEPSNSRQQAILQRIQGGRVLDVGCVNHDAESAADENWLHQHLYQHADEVVGIDYLPEDIAALQEAGYNVYEADAHDFDLDGEFDTVVAGEIIEHLESPGEFLARVREHLAPDGTLVLSTPNAWCGIHSLQALTPGEVNCNPEHVAWYDERALRQLLDRCSFQVESVEYISPPPDWAFRRLERAAFAALGVAYRLGLRMLGAPTLLVEASPVEGSP